MDEAVHDRLIEEVATGGKGFLRNLRYTAMGEPLLHPLIYSFLARAKRDSGVAITLTTDGTLLGENEAKKLLDDAVIRRLHSEPGGKWGIGEELHNAQHGRKCRPRLP